MSLIEFLGTQSREFMSYWSVIMLLLTYLKSYLGKFPKPIVEFYRPTDPSATVQKYCRRAKYETRSPIKKLNPTIMLCSKHSSLAH